jgi:YVTN family beta-propeller protein
VRAFFVFLSFSLALALYCFAPPTQRSHATSPLLTALGVINTEGDAGAPQELAFGTNNTLYVTDQGGARVIVMDAASWRISGDIPVGQGPVGLAVGEDDTIYVASLLSGEVAAISGSNTDDSQSVLLNAPVSHVAVNADETVFVTDYNSGTLFEFDGRDLDDSRSISIGGSPMDVAVWDDSVYVPVQEGRVHVIDATATDDSVSFAVGGEPDSIAIAHDGTIFIADSTFDMLHAVSGEDYDDSQSVVVGDNPTAVTTDVQGRVYVTLGGSDSVSVLRASDLDDSFSVEVGDYPVGISLSQPGLIAVANWYSGTVSALAYLTSSLSPSTGNVGAIGSVTLTVNPPQVSVDDSTVQAIAFGTQNATGWSRTPGSLTWSGPTPAGSGDVDVTATLMGGQRLTAGPFRYLTPPPVPSPPSPPTGVTAIAGDASAVVSWSAPTNQGTFAVTNYDVTSTPRGATCLTTSLRCEVTGLTNGITYTFSVRALSAAGWSASSTPSGEVTPRSIPTASISIIGTRIPGRNGSAVRVTGTSEAIPASTLLQPWISLRGEPYRRGTAQIPVEVGGTFTWTRKSRGPLAVYVAWPEREIYSNRVTIR